MNARLTAGFSWVALLLGLVHLSLGLLAPSGWTESLLWFTGTGLAIVFAAGLNLIGRQISGRWVSGLTIVAANLVMAAFFAAAWPLLQGPQVIVGAVLFTLLAGLTLQRRHTAR